MSLSGDYISFNFAGTSSKELGFFRVSDGSRYHEDLLPSVRDQTLEVPGRDGSYYFGSTYGGRTFAIQVAFDDLSEVNLQGLKKRLGDKQVYSLIFDEVPYKTYYVKGAPSNLTYIGFRIKNESTGAMERVYKGEGTLNFVSFYPYAFSTYKDLSSYSAYQNVDEWLAASGIINRAGQNVDQVGGAIINLYNPGDFATPFRLYYPFIGGSNALTNVTFDQTAGPTYLMNFSGAIVKKGSDTGFFIDSEHEILRGYIESSGKITLSNNIYNEHMTSGTFFKIPTSKQVNSKFTQAGSYATKIDYSYLYY